MKALTSLPPEHCLLGMWVDVGRPPLKEERSGRFEFAWNFFLSQDRRVIASVRIRKLILPESEKIYIATNENLVLM